MSTVAPGRGYDRRLAILVAATFFMELLDGNIIQTAAPKMAMQFGVAPVDINIAMAAYLLAAAVGIPISGWLADRYGGRGVYLWAIVVFTGASALCAFAPSLWFLCVARALQGLGGAMMVPIGRLAVVRSADRSRLLQAMAFLVWPGLAAPVLAPVIGGLITDTVGWPWIFWVNIPIGVVALAGAWFIVPRDGQLVARPLDWRTYALVSAGVVLISAGGELVSDGTGTEWALALVPIAAGAALCIWGWRSMRRREHPLFAAATMRYRTFATSNVSGSLYQAMVSAMPFLFTLLFQVGYGWSATTAGLIVTALFVGNIGVKPLTTPMIRRFGFRQTLVWSSLLGGVVALLFVFLDASAPLWLLVVLLLLSGAFRSIGFTCYSTLAFVDMPSELVGAANTLSATVRQVAIALGIPLAAVFVHAGLAAATSIGDVAQVGYRWAFLPAALIMLVPAIGAWRLPKEAGAVAAGR